MANKRKNIILDPAKINNYNKFLSTLDNSNKKETKDVVTTTSTSDKLNEL